MSAASKGTNGTASDPALDELADALASGQLVLVAGAGVSAASGLPTLKGLVSLLVERARARGAPADALHEIQDLAAKQQVVDALSAAFEVLGAPEFHTVVESALDDREVQLPEIARAIGELAPRLRAILTTNLDRLLERALAGAWPTMTRPTTDLGQRRHFILKLHGTLLERDTWVLTRSNYDRAMYADPRLATPFSSIFYTCPLLFVGYSPSGDDFEALVARVRALAGPQPPRHFALVSTDSVTPYRRKRLESAGIRLIGYDNSDGKHTEAAQVLRALAAHVNATTQAPIADVRSVDDVLELLRSVGLATLNIIDPSGQPQAPSLYTKRITKLLAASGMRTATRGITGLYTTGPYTQAARLVPDAVIGFRDDGSFVVAFGSDALIPEAPSRWTDLARLLGPRGGVLRVYTSGTEAHPPEGVEAISLREALAALVQPALEEHARACLASWTGERVAQRFVPGRAKLRESEEPTPDALEKALADPGCVLLLGEFGSGKSTQLRRHAAAMAEAYLKAPAQKSAPLLLPLRGAKPSFADVAGEHIKGGSPHALKLAVELGMAIPLLDGLDELRVDPSGVSDAVTALAAFPDSTDARVVLSSRPTFFGGTDRIEAAMRGVSPWTAVELLPLSQGEVSDFVRKAARSEADTKEILATIERTHDLSDLAARPVLLDLIVKHGGKLTGEVKITTLYELAAKEWLDSRSHQEEVVPREQRLAFARTLARRLFESGAESVTYKDLARAVLELLDARDVWAYPRALQEVQNAVFIAPNDAGDGFRFAHKSFQEYFLAVDIGERIAKGDPKALEIPRITREVATFLLALDRRAEIIRAARETLSNPYRVRVSENALLLLYHGSHVVSADSETDTVAPDCSIPRRANLVGANLSGLSLQWIELREADLSGADLSRADLRYSDLRSAVLRGASLHHATLDGSSLDGVEASRADLFAVSCVDSEWWKRDDMPGEPPSIVDQHFPGAYEVAWSPNGRWLAVQMDSTLLVIDPLTTEVLWRATGRGGAFGFADDGVCTASYKEDGTVAVLDARTGAQLCSLPGDAAERKTVVFSPGGRYLATRSEHKHLKVYDVKTGALCGEHAGLEQELYAYALSPDGKTIAALSPYRKMHIIALDTGEQRTVNTGGAIYQPILFSFDGAHIIAQLGDRDIVSFPTHSAGPGLTIAPVDKEGARSLSLSPNGKLLARVTSSKHDMHLHDLDTGVSRKFDEARHFSGGGIHFSPDGSCVAFASNDGLLCVYNVSEASLRYERQHSEDVRSIAFSPDGKTLAYVSGHDAVGFLDMTSGEITHAKDPNDEYFSEVVFIPGRNEYATLFGYTPVNLFDVKDKSLRLQIREDLGMIGGWAVSPQGDRILAGTINGNLVQWSTHTGQRVKHISGHYKEPPPESNRPPWLNLARLTNPWPNTVWAVAFSPDGRSFASGSSDRTVRIWSTSTGEQVHMLEGHEGGLRCVNFSPDGNMLASGGLDHTVRLWNTQAGIPVRTLRGHENGVVSVAFSPDGRLLASQSDDGTVRLWSVDDGRCVAVIYAGKGGCITVAHDTPFFACSGAPSPLARVVSGERIMPLDLWAPLFERPDLVAEAVAGNSPNLAAMGLDSYAACEAALVAERGRRGLIRRRTEGMYLENLRVSNVKLLADQEFSFRRPDGSPRRWTVFIGDNGLCKTTILQTIALAASGQQLANTLVAGQGVQFRRAASPEREAAIEAWFRVPRLAGPLRSRLVVAPQRYDFRGEGEHAAILDDLRSARAPDHFVAGYGVGRVLPKPILGPTLENPLKERVAGLFDTRHVVLGVELFNELQKRNLAAAFEGALRDVLLAESEGERLLPWLSDLELAAPEGLDRMTALLEPRRFAIRTGGVEVKLPPSALSQGYQSMVAWISDLLGHGFLEFGAEVKPATLRGLVLIDEIDLHLHPTWQRRIVPILKSIFPQLQFVVTTHSPLALTGFERDEIIELVMEDGLVVQRTPSFEPGMQTASEVLTSYFQVPRAGRPDLVRKEREYLELKARAHRDREEEARVRVLEAELSRYWTQAPSISWTPGEDWDEEEEPR